MLEKGISCPFLFVFIFYPFCPLGSRFLSPPFSSPSPVWPQATLSKTGGYRFRFVLFPFFSSCRCLTLLGLSSHPGCGAPGAGSAIIHRFCAQIPTFLSGHFNSSPRNHRWQPQSSWLQWRVALPEEMTAFRHTDSRSSCPRQQVAGISGRGPHSLRQRFRVQRCERKYPALPVAAIVWVPYPRIAKPQTRLTLSKPR